MAILTKAQLVLRTTAFTALAAVIASIISVAAYAQAPGNLAEACAQVAAKHMSAAEIASMGPSMGLSASQVSQLASCATGSSAPTSPTLAQSATAAAAAPAPAPAGPPATSSSAIEQNFRALNNPSPSARLAGGPLPNNTSAQTLTQFGYNLFSSGGAAAAINANLPVGPDYILGAGDGLNVLMWGRINRASTLVVQRDGTVLLPEVGPVEVDGLTFDQAKKLLEGRLSQITGVQVAVTMGSLRTIQIFILGQVANPGHYTLSALAHVSNALAAAGITKLGSLRNIQLRRDNKVVETIDAYDMLLRGDTSADIRLQDGDVIFVPVIGPVVGVTGSVKSPAIFEMRGHESLSNVLRLAGGVTSFAYAARIEVQRVVNHQGRIELDIDLNQLASQRFDIHDGDLVQVFTVLSRQQNIVELAGNVNRPGVYQWYPGMRVADLVRDGEGVADQTYFQYALVRRPETPSYNVHFLPVDLQAALTDPFSPSNFLLGPRDRLSIFSESDLRDAPTVTVRGAVRKPGTYPLSQGMKVSDLIYEAGGASYDAFLQRAQLARTEVVGGARTRFTFIDINLNSALGGGSDDIPLRRGDELFLQQASNFHAPWRVQVAGQVARPGTYVIANNERLFALLVQTGGLRTNAFLPATVFIRRSVQQMEQTRLDESRNRLQMALVRNFILRPSETSAATTTSSSTTGSPGTDQTAQVTQLQQILDSTSSRQAVGRLVLNLTNLSDLQDSREDLVLEDGDAITIPTRPVAVNVLGQVQNPTAILYAPALTVGDYLQRAGGVTQDADQDNILVIKANGRMLTDEGLRLEQKSRLFPLLPTFHTSLLDTQLEAGDTVYVPEQLVYFDKYKFWTQISQIIANAAQGLAIVGLLATQI